MGSYYKWSSLFFPPSGSDEVDWVLLGFVFTCSTMICSFNVVKLNEMVLKCPSL